MWRITFLAVLCCCLGAGPAPTTRPSATTRPTTASARVRDAMLKGSLRYLVPADWELVRRSDDGLNVAYMLPEKRGVVSLVVTPQHGAFPKGNAALKQIMARSVLKAVNDDLAKRKVEILDPPKLEPDDAFVARVAYRFKEGDATIRAMHAYRAVGVVVVSVTSALTIEDPAEAKAVHDESAKMLLSVAAGPADPKLMRPVVKQE
jgi:hypothetical protein